MNKKQTIKKANKRKSGPGKIKLIFYMWQGKVVTCDDEGNSRIMQDFTAWIFSFFAWVILILTILSLVATIYVSVYVIDWHIENIIGNIVGIFLALSLLAFTAALSLVLKTMSHDIKREKDRHYVLALLSGMIGLVAMIVSVIALFLR